MAWAARWKICSHQDRRADAEDRTTHCSSPPLPHIVKLSWLTNALKPFYTPACFWMLETKLLEWFCSLIINKRTQSLGLLRSLESMYIGEIREGEREFVCVRVVVGCELWLYWSLAGEALRAECCWRCCWLLIVVLCGFWLLISYHCAFLPNFLQGQTIRHCTVCVCMRNLFYFLPKFFRYYSFAFLFLLILSICKQTR